MSGKQPQGSKANDFTDPFSAGQMVGMLVMLTFIENHGGIDEETIYKIKHLAANNVQEYFQKPSEDIFLMVDNLVKEIGWKQSNNC